MTKLSDKIENALNESKTLILGVQVLVGFQFQAVLQNGFEKLAPQDQTLKVAALAITLVALGWLMAPAAYDRIVNRGQDTPEEHKFATIASTVALLPFATALAIEFYVALELVSSSPVAVMGGILVLGVALFLWYGLEVIVRMQKPNKPDGKRGDNRDESNRTPLTDRIKQALTEARIVLPGAQALLGFQFATMLLEGFERLPAALRSLHVACLALIALSTILLMTPAAYHRIVMRGEDSEEFLQFTGRMILAAMVLLALGIAGDFLLVVAKVFDSTALGIASAITALVFFYGLWFGLTLYLKGASYRRAKA